MWEGERVWKRTWENESVGECGRTWGRECGRPLKSVVERGRKIVAERGRESERVRPGGG